MSHRHWCDYAGHYILLESIPMRSLKVCPVMASTDWECQGSASREFAGTTEPTPCMCVRHSVPMEEGDHNEGPMELLVCADHLVQKAERESNPRPMISFPWETTIEAACSQTKTESHL